MKKYLNDNNRCCWDFIECVEKRKIIGWSSPHQTFVLMASDGMFMRILHCPFCTTRLLPHWYTGSRDSWGKDYTFTLSDVKNKSQPATVMLRNRNNGRIDTVSIEYACSHIEDYKIDV